MGSKRDGATMETAMRMFRLDNEFAFVTGAGSGIGQAIAVGLAEAGADVACFDLPGCTTLADTVQRIQALGRSALPVSGDVTSETELADAVRRCERNLGPMSVAVNSAGIANARASEEMPVEQFQKLLDVNLKGVFLSIQAEGRVMLPRRRGAIVSIASMSGSIVNRDLLQVHYNASKAGVIHLSKSFAMEWADRGVRVNTISPGYTLTPMNAGPEVAEQLKRFASDTPMKRVAQPNEMVGPAVFLVSKAASFITGVDLIVDGGFVCW